MKKVTLEVSAEYINWKDLLERLNEVISDTTKEISSLDITYSEDNDC